MSSRHTVPAKILTITVKPGRCWTGQDIVIVKDWLLEDTQSRILLTIALSQLGNIATVEDAEDTWIKYYLNRLDKDIENFDPGKENSIGFWPFLQTWFGFFCRSERRRLWHQAKREEPLNASYGEGQEIELEVADWSEVSDPERVCILLQFLEELQLALTALSSTHRRVFELFCIQDLSLEETAKKLSKEMGYQVPIGSVKGWANRARYEVKQYLQEKGL